MRRKRRERERERNVGRIETLFPRLGCCSVVPLPLSVSFSLLPLSVRGFKLRPSPSLETHVLPTTTTPSQTFKASNIQHHHHPDLQHIQHPPLSHSAPSIITKRRPGPSDISNDFTIIVGLREDKNLIAGHGRSILSVGIEYNLN